MDGNEALARQITRHQGRLRVLYELRERAAYELRHKEDGTMTPWVDVARALCVSRPMAIRCANRWANRLEEE